MGDKHIPVHTCHTHTHTYTYLLMVLYAHRQCVNEDGNHDSLAEVSAANNELKFSLQARPAAPHHVLPWPRHLNIGATRAVAVAVAVTRTVAMARVVAPMTLVVFRLLVNAVIVTGLIVVDAVRTRG